MTEPPARRPGAMTRAQGALARVRSLAQPLAGLARRARVYADPVWRRLTTRRRRWPILRPYSSANARWRIILKLLFTLALFGFGLVYGFYFALTAPYLIVPFALPVLLLVLLSVWALPNSPSPPTRTMEFLFAGVLVGLIVWPNYLALSLPGLPWITWIRLTGIPMALLLLVSLSMSDKVRSDIGGMLRSTAPLWTIMVVFVAVQFATIPLADSVGSAFQKTLVQQVNWTSMFLVSAYLCLTPGRAQRYVNLVCLLALPIIVVAVLESRAQHVLWVSHVPSFLRIDDPAVHLMLSSSVRGATGLYRTKATFSTALGLAEYVSLLTPFAIHFAVGPYSRWVKGLGLAFLPVIFLVVRLTDSRLGVVGFLTAFFFYSLFWAIVRYRRARGDLLSAAIVYSYPTLAVTVIVALNASNRLRTLILGGGAQAASNEGRRLQLIRGIPKILENPIGHGAGGAGDAMGYGEGEFVTVDNYFLTIGLDYGALGLTAFLALFIVAIVLGFRHGLTAAAHDEPEVMLLLPLTAALAAFLVIKSVFSQPDNHPLVFVMLGMVVALSCRVIAAKAARRRTASRSAAAR
jgi:hypothetical protein